METTIEKSTKKINTRPIKDFLKKEEEKQRYYKRQRKDAKLTITADGTWRWDPFHPSVAQSKAYWNSLELRIFYAAYTLLRGKKLSQMEQNYKEDDPNHFLNTHKLKIEKTLEGFKSMISKSQTKENMES